MTFPRIPTNNATIVWGDGHVHQDHAACDMCSNGGEMRCAIGGRLPILCETHREWVREWCASVYRTIELPDESKRPKRPDWNRYRP